jgi:hypothetical protein
MPGKRRPLEALNSIVSACPRDLHHNKSCTNGIRVHHTASRNRLPSVKKAHFVDGATLRICGDVVGPRGSTECVYSPKLDPRVTLQKTISTQPADSSSCAEYVETYQVFSIFSHFHVFSLSDLCCFGGGLARPQSVRAHARTCTHVRVHDPALMFY